MKEKKSNTLVQLYCSTCGEVTWHRRKLHAHVCEIDDTSRRIEGSNKSIPVEFNP